MTLAERINEKKAERAKIVADARADEERYAGKWPDSETREAWEKKLDAAEALGEEIRNLERQDKLERSIRENSESLPVEKGEDGKGKEERAALEKEFRIQSFRAWLANGEDGARAVQAKPEFRALQADSPTAGGYLMAPAEFVATLIKDLDNASFIGNLSTKHQLTSSDSVGAPSLDADPANHAWTAEVGAVSEDSTMAFGARELRPYQLSKLIKVSNKLLRMSALGAEGIVRDRLAYVMGQTLEGAYLTGTGASQPLGVFTASANGISTGQDVSTGNTTTAITFDGLVEAKFAIKQGYAAVWGFSRTAVKNIAKLKDGDGQYLWQPSRQANTPDMLLGDSMFVSDHSNFPSTFTAGLYVGIYGDFSYYWTASMMGMELLRLNELYQANGQVGFISRGWFDGMPVLENAFARVTLAT